MDSRISEIVFIDPAVSDMATLLGGVRAGVEAIRLSAGRSVPRQIAEALRERADLTAVHVIAHGRSGAIDFAAGSLTLETIEGHADSLAAIGHALARDGEVRLWACETAAGASGRAFVAALANAIGAPVAAASHKIGAADRGGVWRLDDRDSAASPPPLADAPLAAYGHVLITLFATSNVDSLTGTASDDTLLFTASGQANSGDVFDGSLGTDTILVAGTGLFTIDLSNVSLLSFERLSVTNTSSLTQVTLAGGQFGGSGLSTSLAVTGATGGQQAIVVRVAAGQTFSAANWTFTDWDPVDQLTLAGDNAGNETLVGSSQADILSGGFGTDSLFGGTGNDTLFGGGNADTMTGGAGTDIFAANRGESTLTFGGSGASGTVSGYDIVTDFAATASAVTAEKISYTAATPAIVADGAVNGVDSTLLLNTGATVKSHQVTGGIIRFDDADTFGAAVSLTSTADVAAVAQYLSELNDLGNDGASVAFVATLSGVAHTFVYIQGSDAQTAHGDNLLFDLLNVQASSLALDGGRIAVVDSVAPVAPSITTFAENGGGGINAQEAVDGTVLTVNLAGTGVIAGDTLTLAWGGVSLVYGLSASSIIAGAANLLVPASTLQSQGDGTFDVTATLTDRVGNVGAASLPVSVTVDRLAPAAPAVTGITDDTGTGGDGVTSDTTLTVSGRAEAGITIRVFRGGVSIGTTTVDGGGAWSLADTATLADGTYQYTAVATDATGNASGLSSVFVTKVDTAAPAGTTVTAIADDTGTGGDGVTSDTTLTVSGTAEAGSAVEVFRDGISIGTTTADGGGAWSLADAATLTGGVYDYTAAATDVAGNVSAPSAAFTVVVDTAAVAATLAVEVVIDAAGEDAVSFTVSGLEPGATAVITFTDSALNTVTYPVSADGTYSDADLTGLVDGNIQTSIEVTDLAGNQTTTSGNTAVKATGADLVFSVNQWDRADPTEYAGYGTVTVRGSSGAFERLGSADVQQMADNGVDLFAGNRGMLNITAAVFAGVAGSPISFLDSDTVTLRDTAANIEALRPEQLALLADHFVDAVRAYDTGLDLAVDQYLAIVGEGAQIKPARVVTLSDTGANLASLDAGQIAALWGQQVSALDATDGALTLQAAQFAALGDVEVATSDALTLAGAAGDDMFDFTKQTFTGQTSVAGGDGADTVKLVGDYVLAFGNDTLSGVERLELATGFDYDITAAEGNLGAGQQLTVKGIKLGATDRLTFDGSAESDGGTFRFKGGAGTNDFTGGDGGDKVEFGAGQTTVRYTSAQQSTSNGFDTFIGFDGANDLIDVGIATIGFNPDVLSGQLKVASFDADISAAVGEHMATDSATLFTATSGNFAGATYLVVNIDGVEGYQAGGDLVIRLDSPINIGAIGTGTFV